MSSWFRQAFGGKVAQSPSSSTVTSTFKDGIYTPPSEDKPSKKELIDILLASDKKSENLESVEEKEVPKDDIVKEESHVEETAPKEAIRVASRSPIYPVLAPAASESPTYYPIPRNEGKTLVKKLVAAIEQPGSAALPPRVRNYSVTKVFEDPVPEVKEPSAPPLPEKVVVVQKETPEPEAVPEAPASEVAANSFDLVVDAEKLLNNPVPFPSEPSDLPPIVEESDLNSLASETTEIESEVVPLSAISHEPVTIEISEVEEERETYSPVPPSSTSIEMNGPGDDGQGSSLPDLEAAPLLRSGAGTGKPPRDLSGAAVNEHIRQWKKYVGWGDHLASESVLDEERLSSLDVFRGLVIAGFILVIDSGDKFPVLKYSAWEGLSFGDFVDPFFLFAVGVSLAIAFKRVPSKRTAFSKVLVRTLKIFLIGLFLQGGYFHGPYSLTYGVSLGHLRYAGILQRLAIAFFIVGLSEIAVMKRYRDTPPEGYWNLVFRFMLHWGIAGLLALFYIVVSFFLYVPDWTFTVPATEASGPHIQFVPAISANETILRVQCGDTGRLDPGCNAAGYLDRLFLGINHLSHKPTYQYSKECTKTNQNIPNWCLAPFDSEGILGTVGGTLTVFAGLHHGHVLTHFRQHWVRLSHSSVFAAALLGIGWVLQFPLKAELHRIIHKFPDWLILDFNGIPFNKQLYSLSFMFFTAGVAGLVLSLLYLLTDVLKVRFYTKLFEWTGRNFLLVFVLAVAGVFEAILLGFYWGTPDVNIVTWFQGFVTDLVHNAGYASLLGSGLKIVGWALVAGALANTGHTWKF